MVHDVFFYLLAALTLVCGLMVVANPFTRNPVTSAMFLVLTIASMSGLFVLLHAFFLAAIQVLVYAGAVMVLFLFVIMLLDLKEVERRRYHRLGMGMGVVMVLALASMVVAVMRGSGGLLARPAPMLEGTTVPLGRMLFTEYLLPFEVVSVLLLVAIVGVVLLSKKDLS